MLQIEPKEGRLDIYSEKQTIYNHANAFITDPIGFQVDLNEAISRIEASTFIEYIKAGNEFGMKELLNVCDKCCSFAFVYTLSRADILNLRVIPATLDMVDLNRYLNDRITSIIIDDPVSGARFFLQQLQACHLKRKSLFPWYKTENKTEFSFKDLLFQYTCQCRETELELSNLQPLEPGQEIFRY